MSINMNRDRLGKWRMISKAFIKLLEGEILGIGKFRRH